MVGNIVGYDQFSKGFNPKIYFDENTHIATEANFIKLLNDGWFVEDVIGYFVTLANSYAYNNGLYVIADVNHDSDNTGQTNCYDLISVDCVLNNTAFNSKTGATARWTSSSLKTLLNSTFYDGYSDIKDYIYSSNYLTQSSSSASWASAKILAPSVKELGLTSTSGQQINDGVQYPIFTDNASRKKEYNGSYTEWWTRSNVVPTGGSIGNAFSITSTGTLNYTSSVTSRKSVAVLFRVGINGGE